MEKENPKSGRKISSTVIGIFIVFSAFAVLNITSITVCAETFTEDWEISEPTWRENTEIILDNCNLKILDGGTLTFNNSVTLKVKCSENGEYGIQINATGKFVINSTNASTTITYGSTFPNTYSYTFTNSGTIDFL